jgi:glycosyltransferase involved in cell wall biosynthesis
MIDSIFTIASANFIGRALTLWDSVRFLHPETAFSIYLVDDIDLSELFLPDGVRVYNSKDLLIPRFGQMSEKYNITELNTAVKPFAFSHQFQVLDFNNVVYLDPDTYLYSRLSEVSHLFEKATNLILTPHITTPDGRGVSKNQDFLKFGAYNLGFIGLRKSQETILAVNWWGSMLLDHCLIDISNGLFVDQKWADLLPSFVEKSYILRHPGYNVAYWNIHERKLSIHDGSYLSNGQELRFIHFSGLEKTKESISRHSQISSVNNFALFMRLKREYVVELEKNRDDDYAKIPYTYNWNGFKEVNLHTPIPLSDSKSNKSLESFQPRGRLEAARDRVRILAKVLLFLARHEASRTSLVKKFLRAVLRKDFIKIRSSFSSIGGLRTTSRAGGSNSFESFNKKRILFLDWAVPTPDRDAGSLFQFSLLRILRKLGFEIYFIPANLRRDNEEILIEIGVKVIAYPEISSVEKWLDENARYFGQIWLSRGPVSYPYLNSVVENAPLTKIIFNTIDLHFLREQRERDISGAIAEVSNDAPTKMMEYELIERTHLTLLVSTLELDLLQEKFPTKQFFCMPLIYQNSEYSEIEFSLRRDLIFIGSFNHTPNWDGLKWFLTEIYPRVRKVLPGIKVNIVGQNPPTELTKMSKEDSGIVVHGFVEDVEALFASSKVSIAPLRFGAGAKGKVVHALTNSVPVIATTIAVEGMNLDPNVDLVVRDDPDEFADALIELYSHEQIWTNFSERGWLKSQKEYSESAALGAVNSLLNKLEGVRLQKDSYVQVTSFSSRGEDLGELGTLLLQKEMVEIMLAVPDVTDFRISGFCSYCKSETTFLTSYMYANSKLPNGYLSPNWREHLQCDKCRLVTRLRFMFEIFEKEFSPKESDKIYLTENLTELFNRMWSKFPNLIGSEFVSSLATSGELYDGVRHEDIENLSFDSNSFNFVISCDVLEHVLDFKSALLSIHRVLMAEGVAIFTFPFIFDSENHETRATMHDGVRVDFLEPEFHGNPIDPEAGSFCWRYYGWDIMQELRDIGFKDVKLFAAWSPENGYLGGPQIVIAATK